MCQHALLTFKTLLIRQKERCTNALKFCGKIFYVVDCYIVSQLRKQLVGMSNMIIVDRDNILETTFSMMDHIENFRLIIQVD